LSFTYYIGTLFHGNKIFAVAKQTPGVEEQF